jgi:tetratricopeptide (TPR) repeat protein
MAKVFISYNHNPVDTAVVEWLFAELSPAGHEVFFDLKIPHAINFDKYIKEQLLGCDAFLIVISRAAAQSEWVYAELRVARRLFKKNKRPLIIPLVTEECEDDWPVGWDAIIAPLQYIRCPAEGTGRADAVKAIKGVLLRLGPVAASPVGPAAGGAPVTPAGLPEPVLTSIQGLLDMAAGHLERRQFTAARDLLRHCEQLACQQQAVAPEEMRARLYNDLALAHASIGELPAAMDCALKARNLLAERNAPLLLAHNEARLGYIHLQDRGLYDALKHLAAADVGLRLQGPVGLRGQVQDMLGTAWGVLGILDVALDHYQQSLALKEAAADRLGQAITHGSIGRTYQRLGQLSRAREHFEKDLELALALEDFNGALMMRSHLAALLVEEYRHEEALQAYREYLRQAQDLHLGRHLVHAQLGLARVHTALEDHKAAADYLADAHRGVKALAEAAKQGGRQADPGLNGRVLWASGDLAASRGDTEEALHLYDLALEVLQQAQGQAAEMVEVLCQKARLEAREGQTADAESTLRRAEELVAAHGLRWLRGRLAGLRLRLGAPSDRTCLRHDMPFPLALLAGRVDAAREPGERLRHLLDLFQISLRYAASLAIAHYQQLRRRLPPGAEEVILVRTFDKGRPSWGSWAEALRTTVRFLHVHRDQLKETVVVDVFVKGRRRSGRLRRSLHDRISRLLELRNRLTHGSWPREHSELERVADVMAQDTMPLVRELAPLWGYRLLARQGDGDAGRWRELRGPASLVQWPVVDAAGPGTSCGEVWAVSPSEQLWVRLTPWWLVRWREGLGARGDLWLFSKRAHARHVYVNIETTKELEVPRTGPLFDAASPG